MCKQNHGVAVDYYAVGIIAYECMLGKRPYQGKTRKDIRDSILARQVLIMPEDIPEGWSQEAADFINSIIQRKPMKRLGTNGIHEVKLHPWLADFPWNALAEQSLQSPFKPVQTDNYDASNSHSQWNDENEANLKHSLELLRRDSVQNLFTNYEYDEVKKMDHLRKELSRNPMPS